MLAPLQLTQDFRQTHAQRCFWDPSLIRKGLFEDEYRFAIVAGVRKLLNERERLSNIRLERLDWGAPSDDQSDGYREPSSVKTRLAVSSDKPSESHNPSSRYTSLGHPWIISLVSSYS